MFNLSRSRQFLGKGGIYCDSRYGPVFKADEDGSDLCTYQIFNGDNWCWSYGNRLSYRIGVVDGVNMLTNKKDGNFTITEIEVWEIKNVENLKKN